MKVLDASAWINVLVAGLDIPDLAEHQVCVPPHFDVEVAGSLRALEQRDHLSNAEASVAFERHLRAAFECVTDERDIRDAWSLRHRLSFRDAWYVSLARRLGVPWVTADGKAARTARALDVVAEVY